MVINIIVQNKEGRILTEEELSNTVIQNELYYRMIAEIDARLRRNAILQEK